MKTMQIALMIGAVALMSGCATMGSSPGQYSVSGITGDPVQATAVAGGVYMQQYNAETQRIVSTRMVDKGMYPNGGYGYGAYGNPGMPVGGFGNDYWYYYRSRGIVPYVQQPAPPQQVIVTPQGTVTAPQGLATQQDLRRVEEKADDALCIHYKQKLKEEGKPITPCPLKK